jgi:hypothetical protein
MSQPFLKLHDLQEAKFQKERRAFVRRHHNKVSVPWLMFCIGFALGVGLMLLNF